MPSDIHHADRTVERSTVASRLLEVVTARPDAPALRWRSGEGWRQLTWSEYVDRACAMAGALRALGVRRGQAVAFLLTNRPEFHVADLGALLAGAVPVSLYPTSPPEQVRSLVERCGAVAAVVDHAATAERFAGAWSDLGAPGALVVADGAESAPGAVSFADMASADPVDLEQAVSEASPGDLATVIFTSGTTGTPKGVMITHRNVVAVVGGLVGALGHGVAGFRMVSAFPMAHIAERVASHYVHLLEGTFVTTCPDPGLLPRYLPAVRPHLFFAVPRMWEKAYGMVRALAAVDPDGQRRFDEALAVGAQVAALRGERRRVPAALAGRYARAELVLAPVRALMGLDECEAAASTAAPLGVEVLRFFRALGLPLSEVYGLSEATGPLTWDPWTILPGDVGRPLPGCEVRTAADGEVLARGAAVFAGYLGEPDATAEALDGEGWLHTGDIGAIERGRLRIIGRRKDLLVTSNGENIAPSSIESSLRGHPLVSEAFVVGDRRPYLVALLTLDPEAVGEHLRGRGAPGAGQEEDGSRRVLVDAEIARWVAACNERRPRAEQIRRYAVVEGDWRAGSEELTPTLKVRRAAVLAKFAAEIDALYR